ncbi:MAG: DNA-directed RNA polymerase subunit A'' [Candidatus Nanohaloarchaea archaeon]|nr:DNA-directed RNA polymerase subunit A'' [Candidatus Nanohaloarchaea archaeon]
MELPEKYQGRDDEEELEERYEEMKFEPGEAVGVVGAQSIAEPATQMSLDASEKVLIRDPVTETLKPVEIGSFIDTILDKEPTEGGTEVSRLEPGEIEAATLTEDGRIVWKGIREISRHEPERDLLKITTKSGREIRATDHHSFVIREEGELKAVSGETLEEGDRIPVARSIPDSDSMESLEVTRYLDEDEIEVSQRNGTKTVTAMGASSSPIPAEIPLNSSTGWFAGMFLSDGHAVRDHVSVTNNSPEVREKIGTQAESLGLGFGEFASESGYAESRTIQINSTLLSRVFQQAFGSDAGQKRVPEWVLNAPEDFVQGLLQGYFEGDGNIHPQRKVIRATSISEQLIDDLALLLSTQGILASISHSGGEYTLSIPYSYADRFRERIGMTTEEKKEALDELVDMYRSDLDGRTQESLDMVAGFGNILKQACQEADLPVRTVNSATKRGRIGRSTLRRHIQRFENGGVSEETLEELRGYADEDVFWDRIESIERVKPSSPYVYDLSVPGTETFLTAQGVVTHNTMETYHKAGAARVSITLGLPRLIEILDARKNPKTPIMDVYLEEGRRTEEDAREIAAEIQEVKFEDVVEEDSFNIAKLELEFDIDTDVLDEFRTDLDEVVEVLKEKNSNVKVEQEDETLTLYPREEDYDLTDLQELKNSAMDTRLKGMKGIDHVVILEEDGEWRVQTAGVNLRKVLKLDGVDATRTTTNDFFETKKVLGIEAARNMILRELQNTLEEQGMNVDVRWLLMIADTMTKRGEIQGTTRYGLVGAKHSVLARSAFEETKSHLTDAALKGETDPLDSVVENIIVGQQIPVGTGMVDLKAEPGKAEPVEEPSIPIEVEEEEEEFEEEEELERRPWKRVPIRKK